MADKDADFFAAPMKKARKQPTGGVFGPELTGVTSLLRGESFPGKAVVTVGITGLQGGLAGQV